MALFVIPTHEIDMTTRTIKHNGGGDYTISGITSIGGVPSKILLHVFKRSRFLLVEQLFSKSDGSFTVNNLANEEYYLVGNDVNNVKASESTTIIPDTLQY